MLKQLSTDICWTLQCPKPSNKAGFITAAWVEWARTQDWGDGQARLRELLDATDMVYRQRRLLFIINGINAMYDTAGAPPEDLDMLKKAAWGMVGHIRSGTANAVGALKAAGALNFLNISDDDAVKTRSCAIRTRSTPTKLPGADRPVPGRRWPRSPTTAKSSAQLLSNTAKARTGTTKPVQRW